MVALERPTLPTLPTLPTVPGVPALKAPVRYPLARVTYGPEEIKAVTACLEAGRTTMGPCVAGFESAFAAFVGSRSAVMVNSGSSADLLCAFSLGAPGERDEVVVPAVTWPTQVWACILAGYRVRLVDVDPETLQMDGVALRQAARAHPQIGTVFLTHLLGSVGDLTPIIEAVDDHDLVVIADCCEALGARWGGAHVGLLGDAAAFSFFFSHLLTTMEGGMVVTDDDETAHRLRLWRAHGWEPQPGNHFHFPSWGMNLRPTEPQGAFGIVQLTRIEDFMAARARNFGRLQQAIDPWQDWLRTVRWPQETNPSWHAFPILLTAAAHFRKPVLCAYLEARGIETRPIVAGNLARQPAVAHHPRIDAGPLPGADVVHERGFYIGLSSQDDEEGTGYVASVLADFMRRYA